MYHRQTALWSVCLLLEEISGSCQNVKGLYKASRVGSEVVLADVRRPPPTGVYLLQSLSTLTSKHALHANSPPASTQPLNASHSNLPK